MKKILMIIALIAAGWYGYLSYTDWQESKRPMTVQEKMGKIISDGKAGTKEIADLGRKNPNLFADEFRNRYLNLSGEIEDMRLVTVGQDQVDLFLEGADKMQVRVSMDLQKYNNLVTQSRTGAHYAIVGHELLFFSAKSGTGEVILRRGQSFSQRARFAGMTPMTMSFNAE